MSFVVVVMTILLLFRKEKLSMSSLCHRFAVVVITKYVAMLFLSAFSLPGPGAFLFQPHPFQECFVTITDEAWCDDTAKLKKEMLSMEERNISPAKRKRLLKQYGRPVGYTSEDLETFLDLLYGMYSHVYTLAELRQMVVSNPFDRSETPRQLFLMDLTDWLEAFLL